MSTVTHDIVAKLWNLCNVLKDDGVIYHQYVSDLTYLLGVWVWVPLTQRSLPLRVLSRLADEARMPRSGGTWAVKSPG